MVRNDLLLDESYNLKTENGDFVAGGSDEQNVHMLVLSAPGMFKEFPSAGAGLIRFVKGLENMNARKMWREIAVQLEADGYRLISFELDENAEYQIDYKPNY